MDPAYITWAVLIGAGVALAFFVKPKRILLCGAALMACALTGLAVSGALGGGNITIFLGVAAMGIPPVFGMLALGASVGAAILARLRGSKTDS